MILGMTAVMLAAREGHFKCLELLANAKGVKIDLENGSGQGLMDFAKGEDCAALISSLFGSGASK